MLEKAAIFFQSTHPSLLNFLEFLCTYKPNIILINKVKIQTIHQTKGQEAKIVFLCDTNLNPNMSPLDNLENNQHSILNETEEYNQLKEEKRQKDLEEHQRLLYVALTRTKQDLIIIDDSNEKNTAQNSWLNMLKTAKNKMLLNNIGK